MKEGLFTLQKNKTWGLVHLPEGKKAVGCKWVFTVKQTLDGKVDRYNQDWLQRDIVRYMELTMMKPLHLRQNEHCENLDLMQPTLAGHFISRM